MSSSDFPNLNPLRQEGKTPSYQFFQMHKAKPLLIQANHNIASMWESRPENSVKQVWFLKLQKSLKNLVA